MLSLVGTIGTQIVGHAVFTICGVAGTRVRTALLGPLAVAPARQRQGIGSAMVQSGLQRLGEEGINQVYVLGDPDYYRRLGFLPESGVMPPYPLPPEWDGAWQSLDLAQTGTPYAGRLSVPPQWQQPALWAP